VIAADTSTWVAFLAGDEGEDTRLLEHALASKTLLMVPAVLTELLSDPGLPVDLASMFLDLPLIEPTLGYWHRAGALRATTISKGRRARLGDALIAQSCIDRDVSLIARDRDFRGFSETSGLRLALGP
jgi:predicted nucleic acid-binding protein